ncbi:MAG: DUF4363 family protein [Clostridia bacterium]|nr:DUF4363 family protein [Clostridia bacterium]
MKRVVIAVAILVLIPALILLDQLYVGRSTRQLSDMLAQAEQYEQQKNPSAARKTVIQFNTEWRRRDEVLSTFIRHGELEPVNQTAARLLPQLENDDDSGFFSDCEEIRTQLEHIRKSESISIDNVF